MSMPVLTFEAEMQPYINSLGDSSLVQANRAGKGYALFTPSVATSFTSTPADGTALPADARHAMITVKGGGIRARSDGGVPSATSGLYISASSLLIFKNQSQLLHQFQFVDSSGETSEVSCMWFA